MNLKLFHIKNAQFNRILAALIYEYHKLDFQNVATLASV